MPKLWNKKNTLENVKTADLLKEYRALDFEEQALAGQIRNLESQQTRLFKRAVSANNLKADDRRTSRKIFEFRQKQNDLEETAMALSQKLIALDRMVRMKEKQAALASKGVWSKVQKMDRGELSEILLKTNIEDREQRELAEIINETLGVDELTLVSSESPEVALIREHIEAARDSGRVDEELASMDRETSHIASEH